MALLHLLYQEGFKHLVVCHLNHGLRGMESTKDRNFVCRIAGKMGYPIEADRVDLAKIMDESGESMETSGRKARHSFFGTCGKKHRCSRLLLAHHADDQAETVLWNLMRGALGFRGIQEVSEIEMAGRGMSVLRPLLKLRKSDIRSWMVKNGLKWREDASNSVNHVARNRLRNEVLPLLNDVSKRDVTPFLVRSAEFDDEWREVLDWSVENLEVLDPQGRLHTGQLNELPDMLKRAVIARYLEEAGVGGVDQKLLERCLELLDVSHAAKMNLPGGAWLRRKAGRIFLDV